ncbi:ATP-binding protein [Aeoliella sp. ICT_H6.2]|uniref:ATP-binding protein n=1 Tax=Aeoliella straminimaris TaxID=2954799 RepID=A0A9X2F602_9BACT|nr:ATP-binding protein [Aeoliella straminimaris]MCO6042860.1 ATP-binding protein [Aeoliella straminimaris]
MSDIDKLGSFYLGREHDLAASETSDRPLLYKSKDLTTHAVCVGMTGSGKTGLCLSLLEEAALDGVPAIAIDPKGDLGNLLLAFPQLEPSDFRPWIDESEAERKGQTPDEYAASTAELWRTGLAKWGEGPERIQSYCDAVERVIFTPGSTAGIPVTVLKSFAAPPKELLDDVDAMRERIQSAASGVLALLGIDADPVQSREHIFLSNILNTAWQEGRDLSVAELIRSIQKPPFDRVGIMDLETFYPAADRTDLAMKLNNLLASPSFAGWMHGAPLSIRDLLYSAEGKPRLSILSIAHLNDSERMFFVTILLNELLAWMRTQPGTSSLRALLYMDEVFGYFPPVGEPPSKRPMLTLLKQARAFGLGCVLATQNPVDLDYKGLSNCGTWFLGRLQTERDKARVIEGLQGASAEAGARFDKREMEATLAALGSRVFLMNNVHDDGPTVFHTRWAMSYLGGPLTKSAIKRLMDPVRDRYLPDKPAAAAGTTAAATSARPVVPGDVREKFVAVESVLPEGHRLVYQAGLTASARVHFVQASQDIDRWQEYYPLVSVGDRLAADLWDQALLLPQVPHLGDEPEAGAAFGDLPSELAQQRKYKSLTNDLEDHLYRTQTLTRWHAPMLDIYSEVDEGEGDFRQRLRMKAREARDAEIDEVEARYKKKIDRAEERVAKAQSYYDTQNMQFWERVGTFVWNVVDMILAIISGGKTTRRRSSSAASARRAATERGQAQRAKAKWDAAVEALDELEAERDQTIEELRTQYDPNRMTLEEVSVKPRKSDIDVRDLMLVWLPYAVDGDGVRLPAY